MCAVAEFAAWLALWAVWQLLNTEVLVALLIALAVVVGLTWPLPATGSGTTPASPADTSV